LALAAKTMRDDFKPKIKEEVAKRAGYRCSKPDCAAATSGPQMEAGSVNIGVAAHITAASENGPRYDPSLTSEERASVNNAIWLCQNHAKLIDNDESKYTVDLLRSWKIKAEKRAEDELGKPILEKPSIDDSDFLEKVIAAYKKKGTPKYYLDAQNLTQEQKAAYYDRAKLAEKGKIPKNNPYKQNG
jgi:hypothetical protein